MLFFTLIIFLILYLLIDRIYKEDNTKRSKIALFCTLFLIFLSGFRNLAVGIDTAYYVYSMKATSDIPIREVFTSFFDRYFSPSNAGGKDPGFMVFEKLFSIFSTDSTIYLLLIGSIFLIPLKSFFLKYTHTFWELTFSYIIYITLFYGYLPNAAIRQSIAMAFWLLVCSRIEDLNWKKITILILFASFIHQSILAGLIILAFPKIKNIKLYYLICGGLFFVMFFIGSAFASFLTSHSDVYSAYANSDYYLNNTKPYSFIFFMFVIYVIGLIQIKNKKFVSDNLFLYKLFGISICLTPLILVQPNFQRFTAIFAIGMCAFVSRCLSEYSSFIRKIAYATLLIVLMYSTYNNQYKFNWQKMELHDRYLYMNIK